eukprot:5751432-Pyramimonas_sp.AAC.1
MNNAAFRCLPRPGGRSTQLPARLQMARRGPQDGPKFSGAPARPPKKPKSFKDQETTTQCFASSPSGGELSKPDQEAKRIRALLGDLPPVVVSCSGSYDE